MDLSRAFDLIDLQVRDDGQGGRVVDAYASVFDVEYECWDWTDGHYMESFKKGAFEKTLREHRAKGFRKLKCLFNHGCDIHGWPSDRHSLPIGAPLDVKEDSKGLFTSTRFNESELGEEVFAQIASDPPTIDSYSFAFFPVQSNRIEPAKGSGDLPKVNRIEVRLREFGPCVFPANSAAEVQGVRSIADHLRKLPPAQLSELLKEIGVAPPGSGPDPSRDQAPPEPGPDLTQLVHLELEQLERQHRLLLVK